MILEFATQQDWAQWLEENHAVSAGVWLRFAKKRSGLVSVTYPEAVEVALCYGWIDAQTKGEDEKTWVQRFLPRIKRSPWSKVNRARAQGLIEAGRMRPRRTRGDRARAG